jgi:Leucine-rich repeat (LRR) protein
MMIGAGLGCREPAPVPGKGRLPKITKPAADEREVAQSPEISDYYRHTERPRSMFAGGDRTGPVVELCGLEIPVDATILRCNLGRGDDPRELARLTELGSLMLFRAPDSIDGGVLVESIAKLPNLVGLDLGPEVQILSLRELASVSSLRNLTLVHPPAEVIPSLAELQQLEELQVHDCPSTDYRPLAALTNLHRLSLMGSAFEDLEDLVGLDKLVELNLVFTRVRELEPLQRMKFRGYLSLSHTPVVELGPLAHVQLSRLDLAHTEVADISPLHKHPSLYELSLDHTKVTDVSPLARVKSLRRLSLGNTAVTDVSSLAGLELEYLDFSVTTTPDLAQLSGFRKLQRLDLRYLELEDLAPLVEIDGLEKLVLHHSRVDEAALARLRAARPELEISL